MKKENYYPIKLNQCLIMIIMIIDRAMPILANHFVPMFRMCAYRVFSRVCGTGHPNPPADRQFYRQKFLFHRNIIHIKFYERNRKL